MAAIAGLLFVLDFFLALGCYSLRDFSRSRLAQVCRRRDDAARFGQILKRHERALVAADFLTTLGIAALIAVLCVWLQLHQLPGGAASAWTLWLGQWLVLAASLFFGLVVVPRSVARVAGEAFLYRAWPLLGLLMFLTQPLWAVASSFDRLLHRVRGLKEPETSDAAALSEEIRSVVDEGTRSGVLEEEATSMIHRVIKLQDEDAAAIMTPRTDMVCIPADCTLEEARQRLLEAGHSRVPVIGKSPDDILGILYAKDLLKYTRAATDGTKLTEITRSPFYIPETASLDTLLETMKRQRVHMAIILDEYGGVSGLVTLEDILEEIVGEIVDEYDAALVEPVKYVSPHVAEVDARMHIDDVNREFQLQLPEDGDYDTIGGFVFSHLGRVPVEGETFTWQQAKFTVLDADKRRIRKLRIEVDESLTAVAGDE